MTRVRFGSALLSILLALAVAGCELVADFDRSRIPMEAQDAGSESGAGGGGGRPDGSVVAPDAGPPVPDAGPPGLDAGPALDSGLVPDAG